MSVLTDVRDLRHDSTRHGNVLLYTASLATTLLCRCTACPVSAWRITRVVKKSRLHISPHPELPHRSQQDVVSAIADQADLGRTLRQCGRSARHYPCAVSRLTGDFEGWIEGTGGSDWCPKHRVDVLR